MGTFPEPSDRWLPPLGIGILALAAVACLPWIHEGRSPGTSEAVAGPLSYRVSAALLLLIGLGACTAARSPVRSALLPFLTILVGIVVHLVFYLRYVDRGTAAARAMLASIPSSILFSIGTPLLWASALVRREHPGDERLRKAGRASAHLMLAAFAVTFILEALPYVVLLGQRGSGFFSGSSGAQIVYSLLRLGSRILLFWATIETLRKAREDSAVQSRAVRIHRLMCGWAALAALANLFTAGLLLFTNTALYQPRAHLWHGVVALILTLTVVCLAARRYRPPTAVGSTVP
jgi:hypothetical protein